MFSVSPSSHITFCGEHILSIVQFLSTSSEASYSKCFQLLFALKPPNDLPHSIAMHFWIIIFASKFFKIYASKIIKIKEISIQGKKHLLCDIEYILNISQALGIFKQEEISFGNSLISLRNKLQNNQIGDMASINMNLNR